MPQDLVTAFGNLFDAKLDGSYVPAYYVGTQPVNGTNHKFVVERTKQVSGGKTIKDFAVVTINIPAGSIDGKGDDSVCGSIFSFIGSSIANLLGWNTLVKTLCVLWRLII